MPQNIQIAKVKMFKAAAKGEKMLGVKQVPMRDDEPKRILDPKRREKLEGLRSLDVLNHKKERLYILLVEKLAIKYGNAHRLLIESFVENFINSGAQQITADDLARLEKDVSSAVSIFKKKNPKLKNISSSSNMIKTNDTKIVNDSSNDGNGVATNDSVLLSPPPPGSEWQVIQAYQVMQDEKKTKAEQELMKNKKLNFRKDLDSQMKLRNEVKKMNADDDTDYAAYIYKDIEKFRSEEESKKNVIHKKHHDELAIREAQIADQNRRRAEDKARQDQFDRNNLKLAADKIEEEKQKMLMMRQQERENQHRITLENEENQRLRDIEKKKEAEEDQRLMREYAAKLDREAFERDNSFKARMEQMAKFGSKFANEGAGKKQREFEIKMEQLLLKEQQQKEERDSRAEAKKKEDARIRTLLALKENEKLKERKRKEAELQRIEDEKYANLAKKIGEDFKAEQIKLKHDEHEYHAHYRKVLNDQMEIIKNTKAVSKYGMADREKALNSETLKNIMQDPTYPKIISKLVISTTSAKS